jgi:glycosyl hydrolase family 79
MSNLHIKSYMSETTNDPSLSLSRTLMNHSAISEVLAPQFALVQKVTPSLPFALTETHSLPAPGIPGITDVFGSALWALDFNLLSASNNISRVHMHQTTDSRSASWQPVRTVAGGPQTMPQYYGQVATAAMVGQTVEHPTNILSIPSGDSDTAIYSAYMHSQLARVMVINMIPSPQALGKNRQVSTYYFQTPLQCQGNATVSRLTAPGHDTTTGVSWDGYAYEADLGQGRPQRVQSVTRGETISVGQFGSFKVDVPHSSAAMITLNCAPKIIKG